MAKKLNFTSLFYKTMTKPGRTGSPPSSLISSSPPPPPPPPPPPWPWPSCSTKKEAVLPYFDFSESCFSTSNPSTISTAVSAPPGDGSGGDPIEAATLRGLRSDRLFFEPTTTTSMLITETEAVFEGGVAVAVDSMDPYLDFKVSMEEMVVAHGGVRNWEWLEEMLGWYLRMNGKRTHGIIVRAFLDLLLCFAVSSSSSSSSFKVD